MDTMDLLDVPCGPSTQTVNGMASDMVSNWIDDYSDVYTTSVVTPASAHNTDPTQSWPFKVNVLRNLNTSGHFELVLFSNRSIYMYVVDNFAFSTTNSAFMRQSN